jgi:hypothetical protein
MYSLEKYDNLGGGLSQDGNSCFMNEEDKV